MISRRALFGLIPAAFLARVLPASVRRYGPLTVEGHLHLCQQGVHLHVYHNGVDVSKRCTFADDTNEGMAELLLKNADGKSYLRPVPVGEYGTYRGEMEVATEIVYGVTFREGAPFA